MKKILGDKRGFSIVEILAVIVILGILLGISAPAVLRYIDSSTKKGYDSIARSAREGAESYLMDTPSFSGEIQIKDLVEDGLLEKPLDPDDGSYVCDGSVAYELVTGSEGELDEYKYTVNLCCSEYEIAYEFPGGETKKIEQADFCRIVRATGRLPGDSGDDDEPIVDPTAPTCTLSADLVAGNLINGAYTPDASGNLELSINMDITGNAVHKGLSTSPNSTNGKVSTRHNEGDGTFTYYGYVGSGGRYNSCELDIVVDTTPPSCPTITAYSNGSVLQPEVWTSNSVEFRFDFDSDAHRYEWFTNDEDDVLVKKSDNEIIDDASKKKTITAAGRRRIGLNVYDKYDNKNECLNDEKCYFIDGSSPTCFLSYTGAPGLNGWYSASGELVMLIQNAGESGVQTGIVEDNSDTINSIDKLLITSDVNTTYRGNVLTGSGARGNCDLELKVDMTPPTIENLRAEVDGTGRKLKATFNDSTSKLVAYAVSTTDSAEMPSTTSPISNAETFSFNYKINFRAATYYVWVRDDAGNITKTSITVDDQYFNISYNLNGGTIDTSTIPTQLFGEESFETAVPEKNGWDFVGWEVSGTNAEANGTTITVGYSDISMVAMWQTNFANYINYLSQNAASDNSLNNYYSEYTDESGDIISTSLGIRYTGSNPKNYVKIGSDVWRIIGIVWHDDGSVGVKLVNDSVSLLSSWDKSESHLNNGAGINEWSQADIMTTLGNNYASNLVINYASRVSWKTNAIYNGYYTTEDYVAPVDPETGEVIEDDTLCENCLVVDNKLYTIYPNGAISATNAYNYERSELYKGNECIVENSPYCTDNVTRNSQWEGVFGLIYPSDYALASTNANCHNDLHNANGYCKNNNWLHKGFNYWTMTPAAYYNSNSLVMYVNSDGYVAAREASTSFNILPTVILNSDVMIAGGTGTQSDPYVVS